jgi:uncharacterized protein YcfJ
MLCIRRLSVVTTLLALSAPAGTHGQAVSPGATQSLSTSLGMVVFPAQGQAPQKQAQDEGECFAWAKSQTGVDPMAPPPAPAQAAAQPAQPATTADGSRLRGAARGAAAGAVIGEVANNDASDGAAVGATLGVVAGGRQSRKNQQQASQQATQQQQQATQQQKAAQQQQLDLFRKGFAACLEPKGYTVK